MNYLVLFSFAFLFAFLITPLIIKLAFKLGAVDVPRPPRNLHAKPTAKLGGLAVFLALSATTGIYLWHGGVDYYFVPLRFFLAIGLGSLVLFIGGLFDDKYNLPAKLSWIFPAIASLIVVLFGIGVGITFITNPFGAPISLTWSLLGLPASAVFSWLWMMGMMFTTKFLDGLDGLVSGIGTIAAFSMFALSLTEKVNQPITATLAIIMAGALLGYLIYAWHPAKIFLGEGGSLFVGFLLGVFSILLGAKIATAFLVMGIPILDVAWVIVQRIFHGNSPFKGDRLHLHFRLLDAGLSQRQTVLFMYFICGVFGLSAALMQSRGKFYALAVLFLFMAGLIWFVTSYLPKRAKAKTIDSSVPLW